MTGTAIVPRALRRRDFLSLSAMGLTGLAATACGGSATTPAAGPAATTGAAATSQAPPAAPATVAPTQPPRAAIQPTIVTGQTPAAAPAQYKEAPQLAQQVRDGKLPPVEQRLPKNPVVVQPVEKVGKYGGTWRAALLGGADTAWLTRTIGYENLVRWDPEWTQVIPNVAESFTIGPDAKEFTFKLREGHKWSDGQPFSADDLVFYVEDVSKNKELTPSRGANPPEIEKIDQYTAKIKFASPNGLFLQTLATTNGDAWTRYPAHYLKQFHQKYNTTNLDQLIREANQDGWVKLFQTKGAGIPGTPYDARWQNKDLPVLHAWVITQPYGAVTRVTAERNPFYFKVDPAGNQLPYLDRVTYEVAQDAQTLVLKAANGEIDMQDRNIATPGNKAVLSDNQQKGGYHFFDTVPAIMNAAVISLNLTHKDPVKRQIFQNKDFRIGLSHAIDRQEIIDVVFVGQGEPWQAAPRKESEFYSERLAKQYTEYDPKRANEHLDRAFPQKDGQGFRLGPDGKRISFTVEITAGTAPTRSDVMNLVQAHWQRVGLEVQVKDEDRALFDTRLGANEHDAAVWDGAGGLDVILNPPYYFPWSGRSDYARAWAMWYTNPSGAGARTAPEEPPTATKQQMDLYRQLTATGEPAKQNELMRQILAIAADQFYAIGIALPPNGYGVVKNNFKNVPKVYPDAFMYPSPAPTNPPQYFIE